MVDLTDHASAKIQISALMLGKIFARMDCQEQAEFFSGIYHETVHWAKDCGFQWAMMRDALDADPDALTAFKKLSEYAEDET